MSDSSGFIYDEKGIDAEKLAFVMDLKNVRRGRISEYADKFKGAVFTPADPKADHNPMWDIKAECAFPSATQNEINAKDAANLLRNGVYVISEGANMPSSPEAMKAFVDKGILYGPAKAANAGGVAVSGLEMSQNSQRLSWTSEEVDQRLHGIMKSIHRTCHTVAEEYGTPGNYVNGANIGGFIKVADAMLDQGWFKTQHDIQRSRGGDPAAVPLSIGGSVNRTSTEGATGRCRPGDRPGPSR